MGLQKYLSKELKNHLDQLRKGGKSHQKRAGDVEDAILRVLTVPDNKEYIKKLPENYKAVDIGERFRLFFKIIHEHNIVYFAWLNDETCLHKQGDKNDCYAVFRKLHTNNKIEKFNIKNTIATKNEVVFRFFNNADSSNNINWGETSSISAQVEISGKSKDFSATLITLIKTKSGYILDWISTDSSVESSLLLLNKLIEITNKHSLFIEYEYFFNSSHKTIEQVLKKSSLKLVSTNSDFELWSSK